MAAKTSPEIAQAVGVIMELSEDERTRLLAESREKYRRDEVAQREYAFQTGKQKGRAAGLAEGRLQVARRLLMEKDPVDKVAIVTGLSLEEVKPWLWN